MRKLSLLVAIVIMLGQSSAQVNILANDFPVSETINASVYRPALAVAPNGSFAVTWGDERYGNTNRASGAGNIFGRILGSNGAPLTANFRVDDIAANTYYTDHWIFFSSPLFLPSGQLVVVWHVNGASGIGGIQANDVYYTAFNGSTGARLGAGVQLNKAGNTTGGHATRPNVAYRPPSTFLAVYEYAKNGNNIGGTLVDVNSGAQLGDAFEMSDNAFNARIYPHVASNGNYTVCVWTDGRTDTQLGDIYSERIVGNNLASTNVKVNDDPAGGYNQYARVAMDAQGNYVVVWIDARSSSFGDLYAQRFDALGNRIGTNFKLTKSNSLLHEYPPGISMKGDGSFVVAWADSVRQAGKNWSIKTRFFGSTGQPLSDIIEVTDAPSLQPDVKIGPTGSIFYTWLDGRENANLGRIYSKIYAGFPITAVEESNAAMSFSLEQAYPNPFNPGATIRFTLPVAASVTLKVFDALGREVAGLVNQDLGAGVFSYRFDAAKLAGGSYYCRMTARGVENGKERTFSAVKKLVLLK